MKHFLQSVFLPLLLIVFWWVSTACGWINPLLLPSPSDVADCFVQMLSSGEYAGHIAASLSRALSGYVLSALTALMLAWIFSRRPQLEPVGHYTLEALRVIPPLSLVPLLILWMGIGEAPKLMIVVLATFFPVYLTSLTAFRRTDAHHLELAQVLRLTERETFFHIRLPAALPELMTGLRLGFGYAWRALIGAELIAASSGLGYLIEDASELSQSDRMMVGILTIAVLGIVADQLFYSIARRCVPWKKTSDSRRTTWLR